MPLHVRHRASLMLAALLPCAGLCTCSISLFIVPLPQASSLPSCPQARRARPRRRQQRRPTHEEPLFVAAHVLASTPSCPFNFQ